MNGLVLDAASAYIEGFTIEADLTIPQGGHMSVIGPSGAGKTSLLSMIAGFVPLTHGRILWNGADIGQLRPGQRPASILFQDQNLFPHLTVADNLGLGLRPDLRLDGAQRQAVSAALEQVGLQGLEKRRPAQLSGGQQSRVGLARILLRKRPLLLLDEAFSALGPALKAEMLALTLQIADQAGATIIMVTHDPQDALLITPQTIAVEAGRALPSVDTKALLADPPPSLAAYLGAR